MKTAVIAEGREEELKRFRFDESVFGDIVDHDVSEIWLSRDCAQDRKLRHGEPYNVRAVVIGIGHTVEDGLVRRFRCRS
jgi:hypothetical protein